LDCGVGSVRGDSKTKKKTDFSDKVGVFLFVLRESDYIFPEIIVSTFVGLAGVFQLGDGGILLLLLSKVLGEGQSVVFFFGISVSARTTLWFVVISCGSGSGRVDGGIPSVCSSSSGRAPSICRGVTACTGPVGGGCRVGVPVVCARLDCGIYSGSLLSLEFGVAIIATPGLMDLLVGVAGMGG